MRRRHVAYWPLTDIKRCLLARLLSGEKRTRFARFGISADEPKQTIRRMLAGSGQKAGIRRS